jgi:hypothetical protein
MKSQNRSPYALREIKGQLEETAEAEEELYKEKRSGDGCRSAWTCLGECA